MAGSSFPVNIRDAKPLEFRVLGELWAAAFADNDLFKILWSKADHDAMLQHVWEGLVADAVARGTSVVRVLERTDNSEVLGVIWFYIVSKEGLDKDEPQREWPEGFNHAEVSKVRVPTRKFKERLLQTHKEFVCKPTFVFRVTRSAFVDMGLSQLSRNSPLHLHTSLKVTAGNSCSTSSRMRKREE